MISELNLEFPHINKVIVHFQAQSSGELDFVSPISEEVQKDIRWYLETYATLYTTEAEEKRAQCITDKLPEWGKALFEAVFNTQAAQRLYDAFQKEGGSLLTISTTQPTILSLPWELLQTPEKTALFYDESNISIRRRLIKKDMTHQPLVFKPKNRLRMLFVVSRPHEVDFIEPRANAKAVLNALDETGLESFEAEFLRPATFENLVKRLERKEKYTKHPPVDILHFDGYGAIETLSAQTNQSATQSVANFFRKKSHNRRGMGYLLFENQEVQKHPVDAETLGKLFKQNQVAFIILSACQSTMVNNHEPMDSVAMQLIHAGIPTVLVMKPSTFISTTHQLLAYFYENLSYGEKIGEALDKTRQNLYRQSEREAQSRNHGLLTVKYHDWFLPALYQAGEDIPLLTLNSNLSASSEEDTTSTTSNSREDDLPSMNKRRETPVPNIPRSPSKMDLLLLFLKNEEIVSSPLEQMERVAKKEQMQPINLPKILPTGFWGRSQELWFIEQAFVQGTRCITISGCDGQGKTELAIEAGRWLYRTNMFKQVCLISYAAFQSVDVVGFAIKTLEKVFNQNLGDVETTTQALQKQPTLLILDNLESLEEMIPYSSRHAAEKEVTSDDSFFPESENLDKGEILQQFLKVVKKWSEAGQTRVLITMRQPNFSHYESVMEGNLEHQSLSLSGLTEQDAGLYFQQCLKLQSAISEQQQLPTPSMLLNWFQQVNFQPLSINLLARQLRTRHPLEVDLRLQHSLEKTPDNPLLTCLNLFLDNLNEKIRAWLPRLGVFQGGVLEQVILLELDELSEEQWQRLFDSLDATGLIKMESIPGITVPYFKFHPALASTLQSGLFAELSVETQAQLLARHRLRYYQLSQYLSTEGNVNSDEIHALVKWELSNLLYAVKSSLNAGEAWASDFVAQISKFLSIFGLKHDRIALNQQIVPENEQVGSLTWYLARCHQGQQLYNESRYQEAAQVFHEVLAELGEPVCDEHCFLLNQLGRCLIEQGQVASAIRFYLDGLTLATQLKISDKMKRQLGILQADLARALTELGDYENAKDLYDSVISIMEALDEQYSVGIVKGLLGNIASLQGEQHEAAKQHCEALVLFQEMDEPALEAKEWHRIGEMYQEAKRWDAAELAYRKAALLEESQGNLGNVTTIWNQLAIVTETIGKFDEAEAWYRKAIEGGKRSQDWLISSHALNNLANLLKTQSHKLQEAQQLAEEAVALKQTLEPNVAKIWATYYILAEIAEKQDDLATASQYRRLSQKKRVEFGGTRYELRRFKELIITSVFATKIERVKEHLIDFLQEMAEYSVKFEQITATIHRVLDGERNEDELYKGLSCDEAWVITAILNGIENPETLEKLFTHFEK